jgi:hypothetical protein
MILNVQKDSMRGIHRMMTVLVTGKESKVHGVVRRALLLPALFRLSPWKR